MDNELQPLAGPWRPCISVYSVSKSRFPSLRRSERNRKTEQVVFAPQFHCAKIEMVKVTDCHSINEHLPYYMYGTLL